MKTQHLFIFLAFFTLTQTGWAQPDSTLNKEVEVIKAYRPSISDAYKISANPRINDTINYTPSFEYSIFSKDISVDKTINHLPVVRLGSAPRTKSNTGLINLGFGNAWTPYAELFVNASPSRKTDFGLQLKHFSTRPNIILENGVKNRIPSSENMGRIFMKNYFRKSVLEWEIGYKRKGLSYYGFPGADTLNYQYALSNSPFLGTKQAFNTAGTNFNIKNTNSRSKLDYNVNIGYNYFWNATGQSEHAATYSGNFIKAERNFNITLGTRFDYYLDQGIQNNLDAALTSHQYMLAEISPRILFDKDVFQLEAGFNLGTMIGADSTLLWNISPKLNFTYHPIKGILALFIGADGGFQPNSYRSVTESNPFVDYRSDIRPSETIIALNGGFKGKISRSLSYVFDVNYSINQNSVFYQLSQDLLATGDTLVKNVFNANYDDLNLLRFGGKLRYSSKGVMVDLSGNYYIYDAKNLTTLSHMPDFDISLSASAAITQNINAHLSTSLIGPREIVFETYSLGNSIGQSVQPLDMIIDINAGVDYNLTQKLDLFIEASNILNKGYQLWYGYNQPRLMVMLGARYTF